MDVRAEGITYVGPDGGSDLMIDEFPSWSDPTGSSIVMCWCFTEPLTDGNVL